MRVVHCVRGLRCVQHGAETDDVYTRVGLIAVFPRGVGTVSTAAGRGVCLASICVLTLAAICLNVRVVHNCVGCAIGGVACTFLCFVGEIALRALFRRINRR